MGLDDLRAERQSEIELGSDTTLQFNSWKVLQRSGCGKTLMLCTFSVNSDRIRMDTEKESQSLFSNAVTVSRLWLCVYIYIWGFSMTHYFFSMPVRSVFSFQRKTKRQSGLT